MYIELRTRNTMTFVAAKSLRISLLCNFSLKELHANNHVTLLECQQIRIQQFI